MDNQQNAVYIADCVQALFALDHTVFTDDYARVAKDFSRLVKADAVFHNVRAILVLVPLEARRHLTLF
jgi:hypothetical protein